MGKTRWILVGIAFAAGVAVGVAAKLPTTSPALFAGKEPRQAALALLEVAEAQAENGSWENIGVARVYYLMGEKAKAEAILQRVTAGKMKADDWLRIGRLYEEAGEWDKAREAFDKTLALDPKDEDYPVEIGALYNLHGDRAKAEELFTRSFQLKGDEVWSTLDAAGSYVGVRPSR